MRLRTRAFVGVVVAVTLLGVSGVAQAGGGHRGKAGQEVIRSQDDCDPATFNAALGPGTCVGDGDTTVDEFLGQLVGLGEAPKWRFNPDDTHVDAGEDLVVVGEGGELHTFTPVAAFGGGCVPQVNDILGLAPVPECGDLVNGVPRGFIDTPVPPGGRLVLDDLEPGLHRFQCLIHPWMHAEVTVRTDHSGHH